MLDYLKEAMELFKELTPENQASLLMYTRLAYMAERSVKKSLVSLLELEQKESIYRVLSEEDKEEIPQ